MKRVAVSQLRPGVALDEPIYTRDKKLLLARGIPYTSEMREALRNGGTRYVYVGEWSDADFERYESTTPLSAYRAEAERMADQLLRSFQSELSAANITAPPVGLPAADAVDRSFKQTRPRQLRTEFWNQRAEATALVEQVCEGIVGPDEVATAADRIADTVISQFIRDPSFSANLINLKSADDYLYSHTINRTVLAVHLATGMHYSRKQVAEIAVASLLADLGMVMVGRDLVDAPRRLTAEEFARVQRHSLYTLHTVHKMTGLPRSAPFVAYQLHERLDGSGYPGHRRESMIHRYAAIVAVADAYDAMTTPRPWREAMPAYRAVETLIKQASRGKYDRDAVRALLHYLSLFPVGSLVRLNTGAIGKVMHPTGASFDRPIVAIVFDRHGNRRRDGEFVDLSGERGLKVETYVDGDMGVALDEGF